MALFHIYLDREQELLDAQEKFKPGLAEVEDDVVAIGEPEVLFRDPVTQTPCLFSVFKQDRGLSWEKAMEIWRRDLCQAQSERKKVLLAEKEKLDFDKTAGALDLKGVARLGVLEKICDDEGFWVFEGDKTRQPLLAMWDEKKKVFGLYAPHHGRVSNNKWPCFSDGSPAAPENNGAAVKKGRGRPQKAQQSADGLRYLGPFGGAKRLKNFPGFVRVPDGEVETEEKYKKWWDNCFVKAETMNLEDLFRSEGKSSAVEEKAGGAAKNDAEINDDELPNALEDNFFDEKDEEKTIGDETAGDAGLDGSDDEEEEGENEDSDVGRRHVRCHVVHRNFMELLAVGGADLFGIGDKAAERKIQFKR